ncbi:MAG: type II secretion system F family protein [Nanoarchaeota archaeon]|nr:type II secretion system F family protein [Nanoarchaeota archaeon]
MSFEKLKGITDNIEKLVIKVEEYKKKKEELEKKLMDIKDRFNKKKLSDEEYKKELGLILKGKKEHDVVSVYDKDIRNILKKIEVYNSSILKLFEVSKEIKEKEGFVELEISEVRKFAKGIKKKKDIGLMEEKYLLHKKNFYGQISNQLFKDISSKLIKKYPDLFKDFYKTLRMSNMNIFSDTYINMAFLSSLLGFVLIYIFLIIFSGIGSFFSIIQYFFIAFLAAAALFVGFYFWPRIVIDGRRRDIRNELPFAIIHMASVVGSGAPLTSAFSMLLKSGEYKALNGEIKRIMNYVNLFGYNLTTALRVVSENTPSKEFKELLNGMRSTVESGGNLKVYLKNKAEDTFTNYKNERKKYVETLATYSDIYTAVLIAAPLLFIVVLVLISLVGSKLGGLDISFIEKLGIYFVIPAFNVAFIIFLNIMQPEI